MAGALLVWYVVLIAIVGSGRHDAGFDWSLGLSGTLIALAVVWAGRCAIHGRWREVALTVPVALTDGGRHALDVYATTLRGLLNGV